MAHGGALLDPDSDLSKLQYRHPSTPTQAQIMPAKPKGSSKAAAIPESKGQSSNTPQHLR